MRIRMQFCYALALTLAMLPARTFGQDSPASDFLDGRPTIRFCEYSVEAETVEAAAFRSPLGSSPVVPNSYWETEQTVTSAKQPGIQELPPPDNGPGPANGTSPVGSCSAGGCCSSGGCSSGGCTGCVGGCGDGQCGCCNACKCCKPPLQLVALAEATFFWPQLHRDFNTNTIVNSLGTQVYNTGSSTGSVEGGLLVGPRITLGAQGCKWGVVGRYWNGSIGDTAFTPAIPGSSVTGITGFDDFRAYTTDLEVQRRFVGCKWHWYGFAGARYASVNNDRTLTVSNGFGGDTFASMSYSGTQFNGAGVTFGVAGARPFHECSPLAFYFSNRYSFLGGRGVASAQTSATAFNQSGFATTVNGGQADGSGDMFIGELQLGIQWNAKLSCLPGMAFVRTGIEYQYWDANAGTSASADSTAFINTFSGSASANANDVLFQLIGLNIGAGIMF